METNTIGRPVRVVSLSFKDRDFDEICGIVDAEGAKGADILALPEMWRGKGFPPEPIGGETVSRMASIAKKRQMYIVCPIYRLDNQKCYNCAVLLDRLGNTVCVYDKAFPYWEEFEAAPPVEPGADAPVYEADFGRVGMAVCFDVNFPEVWKALADRGAELVIWPSAYSAGTTLKAHAINHNYYIVSSTWKGDCIVYDITGNELLYEKRGPVNVSRITLDLDRGIYHENFNLEKRDKLLAAYPDRVMQELHMEREEWFVLRAKKPGFLARELAGDFGLEELRAYKDRSRAEIDRLRGWRFAEKTL